MKKNIVIAILIVLLSFVLFYNRVIEQNDKSSVSDSTGITPSILTDNIKEGSKSNILNISGQGFEKLPSYVLSSVSLEELDISNNNLNGALPAEIKQLKNLRVLKASNNKMTGIPAEIGQLEKLEVLDLANNKLTGLPYEMGNLKNLKKLNLSGNDYSTQDLEKIKQGLRSDVEITY